MTRLVRHSEGEAVGTVAYEPTENPLSSIEDRKAASISVTAKRSAISNAERLAESNSVVHLISGSVPNAGEILPRTGDDQTTNVAPELFDPS